jgi:hypothetical protein
MERDIAVAEANVIHDTHDGSVGMIGESATPVPWRRSAIALGRSWIAR